MSSTKKMVECIDITDTMTHVTLVLGRIYECTERDTTYSKILIDGVECTLYSRRFVDIPESESLVAVPANGAPMYPATTSNHSCESVNVGFTSIRMACRHCGRDMT